MLPCKGAKVFLKEVKGKTFRFTIVADKRTLKLRAVDAASYQMWIDATVSNMGAHMHHTTTAALTASNTPISIGGSMLCRR